MTDRNDIAVCAGSAAVPGRRLRDSKLAGPSWWCGRQALLVVAGISGSMTGSMSAAGVDPLKTTNSGVPVSVAQAVSERDDAQRKLLLQKLRLLGTYMESPALVAVGKSGSQEARQLLQQARKHLEKARALYAQDKAEQTMAALDLGLRAASQATAVNRKTRPQVSSAALTRKQYQVRLGQIRSFIQTLPDVAPESRDEVDIARERKTAERLIAQAETLADKGRHKEANEILASAYKSTVSMLSRLHQGETFVYRLKFSTPADELAYERRRNDSYEMLIRILLQENPRMAVDLQPMADRHVRESRALRERAEAQAAAGAEGDAIRTMEAATLRLVRVLQAGGLPVSR